MCWGKNDIGQTNVPVELTKDNDVVWLESSVRHSCAGIKSKIICWGENNYKQLVIPTDLDTSGVINFAVGAGNNCALNKI